MKIKRTFLTSLFSFFILIVSTFGQVTFKKYALTDSGGVCHGTIDFLQLKNPKTRVERQINKTIISFLADESELDTALISDLNHLPVLGEDEQLGFDQKFKLTSRFFGIYSFRISQQSTCGTSVSYPPTILYLNIDSATGKIIKLAELLKPDQVSQFKQFVRNYCIKNRIDNVQYADMGDTTFKHKQRLIEYLNDIDEKYGLTNESIIVYIKIKDRNVVDWHRRGDMKEIVGEEYMRVNIALPLVEKYLKRNKIFTSGTEEASPLK